MRIINYYKYFSFFLIILSISSFFIGFIYGENSAGAGSFSGDFVGLWKNLQVFLNNDKISRKKIFSIQNYPITIDKLVEILNVNLIKQKYNYLSNININSYVLNLNSRIITKNDQN